MFRPCEIKISAVTHRIGRLHEFFHQLGILPSGLNEGSSALQCLGVGIDKTGDLSQKFSYDIIFRFHGPPPAPIKNPIASDAMGFMRDALVFSLGRLVREPRTRLFLPSDVRSR